MQPILPGLVAILSSFARAVGLHFRRNVRIPRLIPRA